MRTTASASSPGDTFKRCDGSTDLAEEEKGPRPDPGTARNEAPAGNNAASGNASSTPANAGGASPENVESSHNE
eukprot:1419169-Pleurochrysis_carterae.AAC.1